MTERAAPVIELARTLVRRPSVTPRDEGCQAMVARRLAACGFDIETLRFGDVDNLYARRGRDAPALCFAGHTDVVPSGPESHWRHPPFDAHIENGTLFGRGAADMKGSVAAMVCAIEAFVAAHPDHPGSLALVLTSDEEGPARDGTRRVVETLRERGVHFAGCLVGEPSSDARLADRLRVGRRGSLSGSLTVHGVQGHVAYPHLARNPIHDAAPLIAALAAERWDDGDGPFPATSLQFSNLRAGTGAVNVIPGHMEAQFNLRYAPCTSAEAIQRRVAELIARHEIDAHVDWHHSGEPFFSPPGPLLAAAEAAADAVTGQTPRRSTGGGTSDGRFLIAISDEVLELGPPAATIHQIDECVRCDDLTALQALYERVIAQFLGGR